MENFTFERFGKITIDVSILEWNRARQQRLVTIRTHLISNTEPPRKMKNVHALQRHIFVSSAILTLQRHLVILAKEYDYKTKKWFSQYDGKPYEHPIPWKRFQNASPLHPVMNDVILFFEMSRYINNEDKIRCPKCVLYEKKGISGTEFPSNITRQISAKLVDSDECEKAKTVNTSTCNEARFWCKESFKIFNFPGPTDFGRFQTLFRKSVKFSNFDKMFCASYFSSKIIPSARI